jgi:hypothetical protein
MIDEQARQDLALIREAIEDGRSYAAACGPDMAVWGIVLAAGFAAAYAAIRGWSPLTQPVLWPLVITVMWAFPLRRYWRRAVGQARTSSRSPMIMALRMLWLGLGIFMTTLALAALWSGDLRSGWLAPVDAGAIGMAVFATAWLAGLPWLRWVGVAWWIGELAAFALRHRAEVLLVLAALMLLLLAGPGIALMLQHRRRIAATAAA